MSSHNKPNTRRWPVVAFRSVTAAIAAGGLYLASAALQPSPAATLPPVPPALQAEIAANDAAGLPGLDNGVTVPAGCDIRTSLGPNGRPRIEQERTVHRELNQGQTPAWIAVANAQLQAYLQVAVQDYCAADNTSGASSPGPSPATTVAGASAVLASPTPSAGVSQVPASPAPSAGVPSTGGSAGLPASLQAEIAANDAAGLPGLDNGVTVPAGCDIRTSLGPNGRPRIEQERTVHRELNQGQTPAWIAVANAQLQAYLQVAVQDYCASGA